MKRSCSMRPRRFLPLAVALLAALCASPARATVLDWVGGGGPFDLPDSWSPLGPPGPGDIARFSAGGTQLVPFTSSPTNQQAWVPTGTYAFVLVGRTYTLTSTPSLVVGDTAGSSPSLRLVEGTLAGVEGRIAAAAGGSGTVTVDTGGLFATWANSGGLYVGDAGTGVLNVLYGSSVSDATGYLGYQGGSSGTATVEGAGSTWTNTGELDVGYSGTGTLNVLNGGSVSNTYGYLGYGGGSSGTATVDGAGSTWANIGELAVGWDGTGTLNVLNGGSVSNTYGSVGIETNGIGTATVDGAGSTWMNSRWLLVGTNGTGALNVINGGNVSNTIGYLGYYPTGVGTAMVDGAGSLWSSSASLYVGGTMTEPGGTGSVTVSNGGEVRVASTLKVWETGTVNLNAGGLVVANLVQLVPGSAFNTQAGSTLRVNVLSGFGDHPSFAGALQFGHGGGGGAGGYTLGAAQSLQVGEDLTVGYNATGVFTQTGGTNTVGGDLVLASGAGSTGTYDYQGGTLSVGGAIRGGDGTSAFIVGGGSGFPVLSYDGSTPITNLDMFSIQNQGTVEVIGGATLPAVQLNVGAGGLLGVDRGTVALTTALNNAGEVQLGNAVSARIQAPVVNNSGLLGGQGRVLADVANTGELFVGTAERLTITGGVDNDGGLLTVSGGNMLINGSLANRNGGLVMGNGTLRADGGLTNASTMAFSGVTNVIGDLDNQAGGLVIVSGVGPTTFFDDLANNGEIRVSGGTSAVYFGCVDGAGTFTGTGTNYFEGDLCPGNSPAILTFEGNVVFAATNHLVMELAGFAAGTGYDQVNVLGDATLGGELEVLVDRAFRDLIQPTDTFYLMSSGGEMTGEFSNVAPGGLLVSEDGLSRFTVYYGPESLYGAQFVVLGNFSGSQAAIPEPMTLTLLALGGLGLLRRRRRRGG